MRASIWGIVIPSTSASGAIKQEQSHDGGCPASTTISPCAGVRCGPAHCALRRPRSSPAPRPSQDERRRMRHIHSCVAAECRDRNAAHNAMLHVRNGREHHQPRAHCPRRGRYVVWTRASLPAASAAANRRPTATMAKAGNLRQCVHEYCARGTGRYSQAPTSAGTVASMESAVRIKIWNVAKKAGASDRVPGRRHSRPTARARVR